MDCVVTLTTEKVCCQNLLFFLQCFSLVKKLSLLLGSQYVRKLYFSALSYSTPFVFVLYGVGVFFIPDKCLRGSNTILYVAKNAICCILCVAENSVCVECKITGMRTWSWLSERSSYMTSYMRTAYERKLKFMTNAQSCLFKRLNSFPFPPVLIKSIDLRASVLPQEWTIPWTVFALLVGSTLISWANVLHQWAMSTTNILAQNFKFLFCLFHSSNYHRLTSITFTRVLL